MYGVLCIAYGVWRIAYCVLHNAALAVLYHVIAQHAYLFDLDLNDVAGL